jgi:PIN domain nuclease of toxin-antitoxin system
VRLLLDTHVFLWSAVEPGRLGPRTRRLLADDSSEIWLSPLSIWELLLAESKGRVEFNVPGKEYLQGLVRDSGVREAVLSIEVAYMTANIATVHQDPVDRLLGATAAHYDLALVTADSHLLKGKGFATVRADR